ncbi:Ecr family regulatory small membrane protein [Klebsiella variicola]
MKYSEYFLLVITIIVVLIAIWFVYSDTVWRVVGYLETLLYPQIETPFPY